MQHAGDSSPNNDCHSEECDIQPDSQGQDTCRDSSCSLQSESCQSSSSVKIPSATSSWKREHLLSLHIGTVFSASTSPTQIVDMLLPKTTSDKVRKNAELDLRVINLTDLVKGSRAFQLLNNSWEDILKTKTTKDVDMMLRTPNAWRLDDEHNDEDLFKARFLSSGAEFSESLLYILECVAEKKILSEYMYQNLFINFVRLLGIKCQFAPSIPQKNMNIRKRKSTGTPDVIANFWKNEDGSSKCDLKTLFVGKVKREYVRDGGNFAKRTRLSDSIPPTLLMPDGVVGQHGAELLMYLPTSVVKGVIIGMIVEQTRITFSRLTVTDEQYIQIAEGNAETSPAVPDTGPELLCTRSYDYMIRDDREHLLRPLLKFGLLQNEGKSYF